MKASSVPTHLSEVKSRARFLYLSIHATMTYILSLRAMNLNFLPFTNNTNKTKQNKKKPNTQKKKKPNKEEICDEMKVLLYFGKTDEYVIQSQF